MLAPHNVSINKKLLMLYRTQVTDKRPEPLRPVCVCVLIGPRRRRTH